MNQVFIKKFGFPKHSLFIKNIKTLKQVEIECVSKFFKNKKKISDRELRYKKDNVYRFAML